MAIVGPNGHIRDRNGLLLEKIMYDVFDGNPDDNRVDIDI